MSQPYACHQCPTTFATKCEQARHFGYEHFEWYNWQCGKCAVAYDTERGLVQHYTMVHLEILHWAVQRPVSSAKSPVPRPHTAIMSPPASKKRKRGPSLSSPSSSPPPLTSSQASTSETNSALTPKAPRLAAPRGHSDPYGLRGKFYREHLVKGGKSVNQFLTAKTTIEREVIDLTSPVKESWGKDDLEAFKDRLI